jgi:hypothetical protein
MRENINSLVSQIQQTVELLKDEPCELYALHLRELSSSLLYVLGKGRAK